jgi:hypothetical protein
MGVSFEAWLNKDPEAPLNPSDKELKNCNYFFPQQDKEEWKNDKSHINLFWERNFYPHIDMIINDLYAKGLLEKGEYLIDINW